MNVLSHKNSKFYSLPRFWAVVLNKIFVSNNIHTVIKVQNSYIIVETSGKNPPCVIDSLTMVFRLKRKEFEINCVTRRGMFLHSIIGCECWNHSKILPPERLKNRFQMNDSIISYAYWIDLKCYSTDALCPIRLDKFIVFIVLCLNGGASLFVTKCQIWTHWI